MDKQRAFNIAEVIDSHKISRFQLTVIVFCGFIAMLDGFDTQVIAFVAPVMAQSWGIDVSAFGPVFGIGLLGLMTGMLTLGAVADRHGRRQVIILSVFFIGLFSLLTPQADSIGELMLYRFLTGIGLGGAIPNILAMTAEYTPQRIRNTMVSIMFCGFPLGAVLGGLLSARWIPLFGWESVFYLGGIVPFVLIPFLIGYFPESIRFLAAKRSQSAAISDILNRLDSAKRFHRGDSFYLPEEKLSGFSVRNLFSKGLAKNTMLLWVLFFIMLLIVYFILNWLPSIMQRAGLPIGKAIISAVLFNLGNIVGGIAICRLIDKTNSPRAILSGALILGAVCVALVGYSGTSLPLLLLLVFLSGCFVLGSLLGITALATSMYSTSIRTTGVGWALGMGRIGSIIGPVIGGILLSLHWGISDLFLLCAFPVLAAGFIVLLLRHQTA
jgi:AAHS family 4-hydroxybenzoate transporter-like MFS transporter